MATAEARYVLTADDRTERAFRSVRARFSTTARTAARVGAGIAAAGAAGFAAMARDAINTADEVGKLSREIGVSTENLSQMRGVLELTGGSFDGYVNSLRRMQRSIVDLADGSASMRDAFGAIGVSLQDLQGLSPEQQFEVISRALAGVADETQRSARAQEIFGRNSRTVLRLVSTGADEVARLRAEQASLGNTLSEDTTQAAERFNDAIARMRQTVQGAVLASISQNADQLATSLESIASLIPSLVQGVGAVAGFVQGTGQVLGGAAAAVGAVARGEFAQAGQIAGEVVEDVFGREQVEQQRQTNQLLSEVARNGLVGRAG